MHWCVAVASLIGSLSTITFSSEVRPAAVRIGDVFEIHISATWQPPVTHVVPALEQWAGPFEIVRIDASEPTAVNGSESQSWIVRVRAFELGRLTIPAMPFDYEEAGTTDRSRAEARALDVEITGPVIDASPTIRPAKPPLEPRRAPLDVAVLVSEIGLIIMIAGWVAWSARKLLDAYRRARALRPFDRTAAVRQLLSAFPASDEHERFYTMVSRLTRRALEDTFKIPATVLSSTEIGAALGTNPAARRKTETVTHTLTFVDSVRFGGRRPTPEENRTVLEDTKRLLKGTG
jgi:hypothetical protein